MKKDSSKSSKHKNLGSKAYSDAAEYGLLLAKFRFGISLFIGLILLIVGMYLSFKRRQRTREVIGEVLKLEDDLDICTSRKVEDPKNKNINYIYDCGFKVKYRVNNLDYVKTFSTTSSTKYTEGEKVTVYYNVNDPNDASLYVDVTKYLGYIFTFISLMIILFSCIAYYITYKSRFAQAAVGGAGGIRIIGGAFKGLFNQY